MTPDLHREAGDLFERLRQLPEEECAAALKQACAGRAELSEYVLQLLGADRAAAGESFLAQPVASDPPWGAPPPPVNLPPPGTVIGNYRLGARIGAGGMGVVFRGEDLRLERPVAIKILSFTAGETGAEAVQRFAREARAASRLNHPNIVSIYDADFDPSCHCIATEFIEGQTLRQLLAAQPSGLEKAAILDIVAQTASALSAAHQAGIVHRDIKPENIMVRPDGFVKVLDFGLAKLHDPAGITGSAADLQTRHGTIAGTVHYLSPEQVLGKPADRRSDLFSLGVVAYELATGRRPFDGPTIGAVFNAILHDAPPAPSAVRPSLGMELDSLILRLLVKAPEDRIQTASELRKTGSNLPVAYARGFETASPTARFDAIGKPLPHGRGSETPSPTAEFDAIAKPLAHPRNSNRSRDREGAVNSWLKKPWPLALAATLALITVALWLTKPPAPLRIGEIEQVTTDGTPKAHFVTDGTRLFYSGPDDDPKVPMFQSSVNGGDPVAIPQLEGMFPLDISPDRSRLLLGQYAGSPPNGPYPIWSADSLGNALRRVGDVTAYEARWSPKGDQLVYGNRAELRLARGDGSGARTLATFPGIVHDPSWSADGRRLRFVLMSGNNTPLWEVRADGTGAHALLPSWSGYSQRNGVWTPDGREFVFAAGAGRVRDLWSLPNPPFPSWGSAPPQRLTAGPMRASHPEISPDGRRVFFLADFDRGELVRYDAHSETWLPQLGGLSATQVEYSRDGKWMVWVSCPEGSVWRSAVDGGSRLQLTTPPMRAINPRWSPDGSLIAFYGAEPGKPSRLYVAPFAGGPVREVSHGEAGSGGDADGSWSPDGASLVFAANSDDQVRQHLPLRVLELRSGRVAALPESEGLWSPRWSPDGHSIAALGTPIHELWLYNLQTHARRRLAAIGAGFPNWSPDGHFVYYEDNAMTQWYRVAAGNGHIDRLASLRNLKMAGPSLGWIGLTPEGALLATRAAGSTEIYRLDWEAR